MSLQHQRCLLLQLNNRLTPDQKCQLLLKKINYSNQRLYWDDLGLGCHFLFGINNNSSNHNKIANADSFLLSSILTQAISAGIKLPLASHGKAHLGAQLKVWPNAQVIKLVNYEKFIDTYRKIYRPIVYTQEVWNSQLDQHWEDVRGPDWPVDPPRSMSEYDQLPNFVKLELTEVFGGIIFDRIKQEEDHITELMHCEQRLESAIPWNVDNIFNYKQFIKELAELYAMLNLEEFDEQLIHKYYNAYRHSLDIINAVTTVPNPVVPRMLPSIKLND